MSEIRTALNDILEFANDEDFVVELDIDSFEGEIQNVTVTLAPNRNKKDDDIVSKRVNKALSYLRGAEDDAKRNGLNKSYSYDAVVKAIIELSKLSCVEEA